MKKTFLSCLLLLSALLPLCAQEPVENEDDLVYERPKRPLTIAAGGGLLVSLNENCFSYVDNNRVADLVTPQAFVQLGYFFTDRWSLRLQVGYSTNASAANTLDTSAHGFYPYKFKSLNGFLDLVFDWKSRGDDADLRIFYPRLYVGVGYARTYDFVGPDHPWQQVSPDNHDFGFRVGAMGEFTIGRTASVFLDVAAEGYGDQFNGLQPSAEDQAERRGYAGFPLDLRFLLSLGLMFHF